MRTNGDTAGGLELSQSADVTVSGLTATDEPVGVFAHIGATDITLERLAVSGGRRGVAIEKTTTHLVLQASTFDDVKLAGVAIGGTAVELRDVAVTDSQTGVRIERGAEDVTAIGLRLTGGRDGVVATAGTRTVGAARPLGRRRRERRGAHVQPGHPHPRRHHRRRDHRRHRRRGDHDLARVDELGQRRHPGALPRPRPRRGGRHRRRRGRDRRRGRQPGPGRRLAASGRSRRCAAS